MLLWRRISAGFPVPKPLWTDVAWKYQNTGLGHAWICLWLHRPGEFNEVRTKYKRDPRCSLAPPLAYLLSCSFLFFPLLSFSLLFFPCLSFFFSPFSFSFLFFPLLCFSFLFLLSFSFLNFLTSFGHWRFSKCNSMTAPAHVKASWSDFPCSFALSPPDCNIYLVGATSTSVCRGWR